jgi:hypothetical protein
MQRVNRVQAPIRTVALEAAVEFRDSVAPLAARHSARVVRLASERAR